MPDLVNVNGKVVKVHSHRNSCPVPNAVDEVLRLNGKVVQKHEHKWSHSNLRLPDNSHARVSRCVYTRCGIRVMVMLEHVEVKVWDSNTWDAQRGK